MTARPAPIGALVLAAGSSSRLGRPKQLVVHAGRPLVARAAEAALRAGATPVIVVLGAHEPEVRAALAALNVLAVANVEWQEGIGTSVATGVRALVAHAPSAGGVLLTLADQPLVDGVSLRRLIDAWVDSAVRDDDNKAPATIAAAAYAETIGVPALFGRAHFEALCTLRGPAGAGALLRAAGPRVRSVPMPEAAVDVDTPGDVDQLDRLDTSARRTP